VGNHAFSHAGHLLMRSLYGLSKLLNSVLTFFLLVSLLILLRHFLSFVDCYYSNLSELLNKHAPLKSKIAHTKPCNLWYTQVLKSFNLPNVILNVSGFVLIHLKILKIYGSATNHYQAAIIKLNEPITLLLFQPALLILINFGKISIYFFFACSNLLWLSKPFVVSIIC